MAGYQEREENTRWKNMKSRINQGEEFSGWRSWNGFPTRTLNEGKMGQAGSGKIKGFPGGSDSKESACNAGYPGLIPGSGRSSGGGHDNPLQYSCLDNPTDRGAWKATVHKVKESDMTEVT